jgi:hypothetical protein
MSDQDDDSSIPGYGVLVPVWMMDAAPLLFLLSLFFLLHYYSTRRQSHQSRFMSMKEGFQKSVDYTAKHVRGDNTHSLKGAVQVPVLVASTCPAVSGTYKTGVKFEQITQFQKPLLREVPLLECQTELLITRETDGTAGWTLSGRRPDSLGNWEIEEGYLSPSGQAYWVEHGIMDHRILVHGNFGKFAHGNSFLGEWLSSSGERGSFVEFTYIPPQQPACRKEVHVAVPVSKSKLSLLWKIWPFRARPVAVETAVPVHAIGKIV